MRKVQLYDKICKGLSITEELELKIDREEYEVYIKDYRVRKYISKGSFGSVYKGFHIDDNRQVAIKLIDIDRLYAKHQNQEVRQKVKKYLSTEQILLKKCHSANVIKLYDVIQNQRCKVLILQYCNGGGLDSYIKQRWALEEGDAIVILRQIILGLAEMHRNSIIHRDLKPPNILIHNGVFKLADFGFAKQIQHQNQIVQATTLGSRTTMAPQIKNDEPYGLKADIWSLGMIFFLMIYGDRKVQYNERHNIALKIAKESQEFNFKLINGQMISKEAADFLRRTLQVDQKFRMNWQLTLQHPLFLKKMQKMPSILVPCEDQTKFKGLKQHLISIEQQMQYRQNSQGIDKLIEEHQKYPEPALSMQQSQICYEELNRQYLQCRKAEFIYNSIVLPLQRLQLLQEDCRKHIELMMLLCVRCSYNVSFALSTINRIYPKYVSEHFKSLVKDLSEKVNRIKGVYDKKLYQMENKGSEIFKDVFSKLFSSTSFKEKDKYLTMIEGIDFTREDQILFTYEKYLVDIINELKGNPEDERQMKNKFKAYRQINEITIQDLKTQNLDTKIQEIIKDLQ